MVPPKQLRDYGWLATRLGVKRNTLQSMVHRKQIPAVRLSPRLVRFDEDEIESWIAGRKVAVEVVPNPHLARRIAERAEHRRALRSRRVLE